MRSMSCLSSFLSLPWKMPEQCRKFSLTSSNLERERPEVRATEVSYWPTGCGNKGALERPATHLVISLSCSLPSLFESKILSKVSVYSSSFSWSTEHVLPRPPLAGSFELAIRSRRKLRNSLESIAPLESVSYLAHICATRQVS